MSESDFLAANMNTEGNQGVIRTSLAVIRWAWVMGALCGFGFGFVCMRMVFQGNCVDVAAIIASITSALLGFGLGASFVGICGLLAGAELGRGFSYPFAVALCTFSAILVTHILDPYYQGLQRELFAGIWLSGLVLGIGGGIVLARCIRGYGRDVRGLAAGGAIAMALLGLAILGSQYSSGHDVEILFVGLYFGVLGGALGAVAGAIRFRLKFGRHDE